MKCAAGRRDDHSMPRVPGSAERCAELVPAGSRREHSLHCVTDNNSPSLVSAQQMSKGQHGKNTEHPGKKGMSNIYIYFLKEVNKESIINKQLVVSGHRDLRKSQNCFLFYLSYT